MAVSQNAITKLSLSSKSQGVCFICTKVTTPDANGKVDQFCLRPLSSFAGLNWTNLFDISTVPSENWPSLITGQVLLPVCKKCSLVTEAFSRQQRELNELTLRVNSTSKQLAEMMEKGGTDLLSVMTRRGLVMQEKILREGFWSEIVKKCAEKNDFLTQGQLVHLGPAVTAVPVEDQDEIGIGLASANQRASGNYGGDGKENGGSATNESTRKRKWMSSGSTSKVAQSLLTSDKSQSADAEPAAPATPPQPIAYKGQVLPIRRLRDVKRVKRISLNLRRRRSMISRHNLPLSKYKLSQGTGVVAGTVDGDENGSL